MPGVTLVCNEEISHGHITQDIGGAAAIRGILKPAAAAHEMTAGPKRKLYKVRIQDGS